jgi:hypothetical protein
MLFFYELLNSMAVGLVNSLRSNHQQQKDFIEKNLLLLVYLWLRALFKTSSIIYARKTELQLSLISP